MGARDPWLDDKTQRYRTIDAVKARGEPCHFCGAPIDLRLKHPDPGAFQVHHKKSRRHYPDLIFALSNCTGAHASCNKAADADPTHGEPMVCATSRDW